MSNNTILKALERMGYKGRMTGHGFRGVAQRCCMRWALTTPTSSCSSPIRSAMSISGVQPCPLSHAAGEDDASLGGLSGRAAQGQRAAAAEAGGVTGSTAPMGHKDFARVAVDLQRAAGETMMEAKQAAAQVLGTTIPSDDEFAAALKAIGIRAKRRAGRPSELGLTRRDAVAAVAVYFESIGAGRSKPSKRLSGGSTCGSAGR